MAAIVKPTKIEEQFWQAVQAQDVLSVKNLLQSKNGRKLATTVKKPTNETPLHLASSSGCNAMVKALIESGAEINATDNDNWTAVHLAAINSAFDVIHTLLSSGADPNIKNKYGRTMIHSLMLVKQPGDIETTMAFLKRFGASLDVRDNDGCTPLHYAAMRGTINSVRFLLTNGSSVNSMSKNGETPLHYATRKKRAEVIQLLLTYGSDPSIKSFFGTPSDIAILNDDQETVECLLGTRIPLSQDQLLKTIISIPKLCELFFSYLTTSHSEENLAFWMGVENFRSSPTEESASRLISDFIKSGSRFEINIDSQFRSPLLQMDSLISSSLFDRAQEEIFAIILHDLIPKFQNSETYKSYRNGILMAVNTSSPMLNYLEAYMRRAFMEISREKKINESLTMSGASSPTNSRECVWEVAISTFESTKTTPTPIIVLSASPMKEQFNQLCRVIVSSSSDKLNMISITHSELSNSRLNQLLIAMKNCNSIEALDFGFNFIKEEGAQSLLSFISTHPSVLQCNLIGNSEISFETLSLINDALSKNFKSGNISKPPPSSSSSVAPSSSSSSSSVAPSPVNLSVPLHPAPPIPDQSLAKTLKTANSRQTLPPASSVFTVPLPSFEETPPSSSVLASAFDLEDRNKTALDLLPSPHSSNSPSSFEYSELIEMVLSNEQPL